MSTNDRTRNQLDSAGYSDSADTEPADSPVARPIAYPIEESMEAALSASDPIDSPPHPRTPEPARSNHDTDWITEPVGATKPDSAPPVSNRTAGPGQPSTDASVTAAEPAAESAARAAATGSDTVLAAHGTAAWDTAGQRPVSVLAHAEADPPLLTPEEAAAPLQPWQRRFVAGLLHSGGIVALACRCANVSRGSANAWRERDTLFARLWEDALQHSTDLIEGSLYVSAVHGNLQPIYQGGILAGYKRVKDTKAAEILLKARRPEVYAPEQVVRIKGDAKVTVVEQRDVAPIVTATIAALFAARAAQLEQRPPIDV